MGAANRTKSYLVDKLLELNKTVPLRKISISSLAKYCDMNRGTLYYHFQDIQDLINYVYHVRVTEPLRKLIKEDMNNWDSLSLLSLELMAKDGSFYRDAFTIQGQNDLFGYISSEVKGNWHMVVDIYLEKRYPELQINDTFYYVSDYLASGALSMMHSWVVGGMKQSPAEIAELLNLCAKRGLYVSLDHLVENS